MSGIIAISGKSGCGNSTVSALVARKLGFELVNFTFKNLAAERGLSFEKVMELARLDDSFDLEVDRRQVELALQGKRVVGSRLAIWVLRREADLRVYLWASPEVRAARIRSREGGGIVADPEYTKERDRSDHERYLRLYGFDNDEYAGVDLVINTERYGPEAISDLIVNAWKWRRTAPDARSLEGGQA